MVIDKSGVIISIDDLHIPSLSVYLESLSGCVQCVGCSTADSGEGPITECLAFLHIGWLLSLIAI